MKGLLYYILGIFLLAGHTATPQNRGDLRVMFYNTENLFDIDDDPATNDKDFTPKGRLLWDREKYNRKLQNLYKVIAGVGGWQPPEIIGFAEVENQKVLNDLLYLTPLSKFKYSIVHFESPDNRGIDVALLFRADKIKLLKQQPVRINFPDAPDRKTRDILYAQLLIAATDTLNIFINHWPSRRGGELESEAYRIQAATVLRQQVNLLFSKNPRAKLLLMGDFNDEPNNVSITKWLKAQTVMNRVEHNQLYNLTATLSKTSTTGTHNFRGQWSVIDQAIVSGNLLLANKGLTTKPSDIHIFSENFVLQPDEKNMGQKPFPTYSGPKYIGGFSDHLPIFLDFYIKK